MPLRGRGNALRRSVATSAALNMVAETAAAAAAGYAPDLVFLSFTPVHAVLGGLLLGVATAGKLLTTGRILGISGSIRGLVNNDYAPWRFAFLAGMVAGSVALVSLIPESFEMMRASCPLWRAALSGLLVGWGTSMGNGCTSGHGICGTARLSTRSLAFTATFMASGMLSATALQSARCAGIAPIAPPLVLPTPAEWRMALVLLGAATAAFLTLALAARVTAAPTPAAAAVAGLPAAAVAGVPVVAAVPAQPTAAWPGFELAAEFLTGTVFAVGLGFSGMAHPTKVVAFLSPLYPAWDLTLPFVMAGAVAVALLAFQGVMTFKMMPKPCLMPRFQLPTGGTIDARLLLGGALFGAGWGMSGLCPGPALLNAVVHKDPHIYAYLTTMMVGMAIDGRLLSGLMAAPKKA